MSQLAGASVCDSFPPFCPIHRPKVNSEQTGQYIWITWEDCKKWKSILPDSCQHKVQQNYSSVQILFNLKCFKNKTAFPLVTSVSALISVFWDQNNAILNLELFFGWDGTGTLASMIRIICFKFKSWDVVVLINFDLEAFYKSLNHNFWFHFKTFAPYCAYS